MQHPLIGVQLGAHSAFDEGAGHCLDILQETAGVNAVFVYTHTYQHFDRERAPGTLASDHGVAPRNPRVRKLTSAWVEPHEECYANTCLRHLRNPREYEFADRDILEELAEPVRKRGMKLYGRCLEGFGPSLAKTVPNWTCVLSIDVYGRPCHLPCWNNPDYQNWWIGTAEDLFRHHALDGFQWGAERVGPLSHILFNHPHNDRAPGCFCTHCQQKGRAKGITVERARAGFQALYEFCQGVRLTNATPADGMLVSIVRLLFKFPEILAWEMLWRESKEALMGLIYGTMKTIRPEAEVGRHIDHQQSTWDLLFRAQMSLSEIANTCDFIKPIVYHDIAGPRIKNWFLRRVHETTLREVPMPDLLALFYSVSGLNPAMEPPLEEMDERGLSPDYVYRVTKRCVDGVAGKVPVYAGVGFDVPWDHEHFPSDPDHVYQATVKAFEAGAAGIVLSREYDEMRLPNLKAAGRAIRDVLAGGGASTGKRPRCRIDEPLRSNAAVKEPAPPIPIET